MKEDNMDKMVRGWFIGNFEPTAYKTNDCEVAYKKYIKGSYEEEHYHKIATEVTLIAKGKVIMFDKEYNEGSIVIVEPGDVTDFKALEDTETVVVKIPGVNNDKYVVEEE